MITTQQQGGLWVGLIDGEQVTDPYMRKGLAVLAAKRVLAKRENKS